MSEQLKTSLEEGGKHHLLSLFIGTWKGITRTWFKPDELSDESPMQGTIRSELDGRFIVHEYEGTLMGQTMVGRATFGFNMVVNKFESSWIDNCHMNTGLMFSRGDTIENGFEVTGSYDIGGGHPQWGWRTELVVVDPDHIRITMFNITPDGQEAKGVETEYERVGGDGE